MKGIVSTEHIPNSLLLSTFNGTEYLYKRVWDVSDVVYPPDGSKEFFVLTNLVSEFHIIFSLTVRNLYIALFAIGNHTKSNTRSLSRGQFRVLVFLIL